MLHNNTTHHKITRLCSVVVNLVVSAVDNVFEELNLDLLLLLLILPFSLLNNTAIPFNENKKQQ